MKKHPIILVTVFLVLFACGEKETSKQESLNDEAMSVPDSGSANLTPEDLRAASLHGDIELVGQAIEQGVDLQEADPLGRTALMFASYNGHTEVARLLVAEGAEVDEINSEGRTPLMFAASGPFPDTVEFLLQEGADPDTQDLVEGWTPLMYAAAEGNTEVVDILLDYQADISLEDKDGETALDFAAANGHNSIAERLQQNQN